MAMKKTPPQSKAKISETKLPASWTTEQEWVVRDDDGLLRGVCVHRWTAEYMAVKSLLRDAPNPNKV